MKSHPLSFISSTTKLKSYLPALILALSALSAGAQSVTNLAKPKETVYMLPEGTIIGKDKLDSVSKAWGGVMFQHNEQDDDKGIMHLVRITDEMRKRMAEEEAKRTLALKAMINHPAGDFSLTDLKGKTYSLKNLKGKVVVLNFWFTSCPPCIAEMPELNTLAQQFDKNKVLFLALTFNDGKHVEEFLKEHEFNYTILPNSHQVDKQYNISSWPTSIVINKIGIVTLATNGSPNIQHDLAEAINASL